VQSFLGGWATISFWRSTLILEIRYWNPVFKARKKNLIWVVYEIAVWNVVSCALRFYCHRNSEVGLLVGTVCAECYTCYLHSRRLDSVGCCCGTWSARVHAAVSGWGNIPGACCCLAEAGDVRTLTVDTVAFVSVSWGVNEHEHVTWTYFSHIILLNLWLAHISWRTNNCVPSTHYGEECRWEHGI